MNFELGGHIVQKVEQKKKEGKRPFKKKKTSKLPQKQPAKEWSPGTQQTDSSLRAMKMEGYTEGCAG